MPSTKTTKARPIIFSGEMVRAILDGRKTQTRRIVKPQPEDGMTVATFEQTPGVVYYEINGRTQCDYTCPYGAVGERLWVKESLITSLDGATTYAVDGSPAWLKTESATWEWKVKKLNARFCPRWASRITIEITEVRVERLQEISTEDAYAEGCRWERWDEGHGNIGEKEPIEQYCELWKILHGPGSWEENPFVWVLAFKRDVIKAANDILDGVRK